MHTVNRTRGKTLLSANSRTVALVPFMLLPFALYAGVAAQGSGLYLFGMIWPGIAYASCWKAVSPRRDWFKIGLAMFLMWWIFPLSQFLNQLFPMHETVIFIAEPLTTKQMLASQLPSTWGVTGLALCLFGLWPVSTLPSSRPTVPVVDSVRSQRIILAFITASAIATTVYGIYFLIQHFTGFDYRLEGFKLPPNQTMAGSRYRISGLYGHPLSMAGVSLAQFAFFGWLALAFKGQIAQRKIGQIKLLCFYIAAGNFLFLVLSGGRSALLAGVFLAVLAAMVMVGKRFSLLKRWALGILTLGAVAMVAIYGGIHARFIEVFEFIAKGEFHRIERLVFWNVHWQAVLDNPWYGQGAAQLALWLREAYYDALGFEHFHQKYNAHNIYLETLTDVGILGCLLLGSLFWFGVKKIRRLSANSYLGNVILGATTIAIVANTIHGLTQNVFFDASVMAMYMSYIWVLFWVVMVGSVSPEDQTVQ